MSPIHEGILIINGFLNITTVDHFKKTSPTAKHNKQVKEDEMDRYEAFWAANSYVSGAYGK